MIVIQLLEAQGKYDEALEYHQRSLRIKEQTVGTRHPEYAASVGNIGKVSIGGAL